MKPTIYLALTHDWELRGNGSGDIEKIQFAPMRELLKIYERLGVRTTFCPDVAQQLAFRRLQSRHPELKNLADAWDDHLLDAFRRGHDLQLHLHPQWRDATYEQDKWHLSSDWSILNYEAAIAHEMLAAAKNYLETLVRGIASSYECVAFRAGALAIAPSPCLLKILISLGLKLDVSLAPGLHFETRNLKLDFRNCEEPWLPFYPQLEDARKISKSSEEMVCVPIHHFYGGNAQTLREHIALARRKLRQRLSSQGAAAKLDAIDTYARMEWAERGQSSLFARIYSKGISPYLKGKYLLADTAHLSYPRLRELLRSIRKTAAAAGVESVPVVLTNHPKDISDFGPIEKFVAEAAAAADIQFITLGELAEGLRGGRFAARKAAGGEVSPAARSPHSREYADLG